MVRHKGSSHKHKGKRQGGRKPNNPRQGDASPRVVLPPLTTASISIPLRPNTSSRYSITIVPQVAPSASSPQIQQPPEGSPRTYRITFVLSVPGKGIYHKDLDFDQIMESGDSLLIVNHSAVQYNIKLASGHEMIDIVALPNARHALAKLQMRVAAQDFTSAARFAHDIIMPLLSRWSYDSDVAIDVTAYEVHEEATASTRWTIGILGQEKGITVTPEVPFTPVLLRLLSSYREGLTATNPFYRVLCFSKVIEGVTKQRAIRRERTLGAGKEYREPPERIPEDDANFPILASAEREQFKDYYGKKFTAIIDKMRPLARNAVAHLDPSGDSLVADSYDDTRHAEDAIPVLKYIARGMLGHEIRMQTEEVDIKPQDVWGPH